ncbi:MAG: (Fe-S)-binding protein [Candidatus Hodarchaeota archaeon]
MTDKLLKKYEYGIYRCVRCGVCRAKYTENVRRVCPSREFTGGFEQHFARGRIAIARGLLEGEIDYSPELAESIGSCTTCGNCTQQCSIVNEETGEFIVDVVKFIEAMRADLADRDMLMDKQKVLVTRVEEHRNPYGEPIPKRLDWAKELEIPNKASIMFFVGCTSSFRRQEIAQATAKVLKKIGVEFGVSGEEWCCGSPLLRTGSRRIVEKLIEKNVSALGSVESVITSCPGCYKTLKEDYPEFLGDMPFEVLHISEFLAGMLDKGEMDFKKPQNLVVTYHDPCHLGRHLKVYEEPRKLLRSIPGINFVEMDATKENAFCCGAGGGVKITFPEVALGSAEYRLTQANEVGAELIVSVCPFCKTNIQDAIEKKENTIKFADLMELLDSAL